MSVEKRKTILIVDDEADLCALLRATLSVCGYDSVSVSTGEGAIEYMLKNAPPALVLLDVNLPGIDGLETLSRLRELVPQLNVVMISCLGDTEKVVAAIKLGACNYMVKPFSNAALEKALEQYTADEPPDQENRPGLGPLPFLCFSDVMRRLRENTTRVAVSSVPVLLLGESGVGKEVVARHLHYASRRAAEKFIKVNCAALPSDLLESELFGYERGAFTGASGSKPGKFELAHDGTLFLDEIAEMHPFLQAKLLHVLQDGRYFRLGATIATQVQVRVIAATNVDVQRALEEGKLRQDLYYRLNVFSIRIPPLRERREEIPAFVRHFLNLYAPGQGWTVSDQMLEAMVRYHWPGNLRELENFIRRLAILRDESQALAELTQRVVAEAPADRRAGSAPAAAVTLKDLRRETERRAISEALERTQWRRKEAAKVLNISYKALLYKMRELELTEGG